MRDVWMMILAVALLLVSFACCAQESTPDELHRFGSELPRIVAAAHLKMRVAVAVISPRLMGVEMETAEARIVILDHGYVENVKTLKHGLNHLQRFERGDSDWKSDGQAIQAETAP
jgi:hypothetical protein